LREGKPEKPAGKIKTGYLIRYQYNSDNFVVSSLTKLKGKWKEACK